MSEKKLSEILQEKDKAQDQIIQAQNLKIENLEKKLESLTTSTSKPPHTHSGNVEFDCPECQQEYDKKVGAKAVSDFKKQVKGMKRPTLCEGDDCGEIYDAEEKEECPTCHRHTD